jgi:hypothetical protein
MENKKPRTKELRPLLDAGYTIIPLHRPFEKKRDKKGVLREAGKRPLDTDWTKKTYDSQKVVKRLGGEHNLGVRLTAEDLVLDIDPRNQGDDSFAKLRAMLPDVNFDDQPQVITGSGGRHIYFRKPADFHGVETLDDLAGIEFKQVGRQLVAPGSIHPTTGKRYVWDDNAPGIDEVQAAPKKLLKIIKRPPPSDDQPESGDLEPAKLAELLEHLDPTDFDTNDSWLPLMMACHYATGGRGRDEFIYWSIGDPKFSDCEGQIGARWDSCTSGKAGGITQRSLYKTLREHGCPRTLLKALFDDESPDQFEDARDDFDDRDSAVAEIDADDFGYEEQTYDDEDDLPTKFEMIRKPDGTKTNKPAPTRPNLRLALDKLGVRLSYDQFTRRAVIKGMRGYGPFLGDPEAKELRFRMTARFGLQGNVKTYFEQGMETLARRNAFHPVKQYLDSVQWDGTPRIDRWLTTYGGAADTPLNRAFGAIVLTAAVRRVRKPGVKFDELLTLESEEGKNKSSALRILAVQNEWFTDSAPLDADDKHMIEATDGKWIAEIPELQQAGKNDWDKIKSNLSRSVDRARMSYGHFADDRPRQFVCIGTTNSQEYLHSPYGNRRFWPVKIGKFDLAALERDRDQLWAEAAAREAEGASIRLPENLWKVAAAEQDRRQVVEPFLEVLHEKLEGHEGTITTEDVWKLLGVSVDRRSVGNAGARMAAAMRKLGWEKPNKLGQRRVAGRITYCYVKGDTIEVQHQPLTLAQHGKEFHVVNQDAFEEDEVL